MITLTSLFLLGLCFCFLYFYLRRHFSIFERLGIPGPKPTFLFGNLPEIMKKGQLQAIIEWKKEYGRVFGYYEGYTPVLSVSDPEILKEVLVKDFGNFRSRKPFPLAPRKSLGLFLENGDKWKRSRSLLTPAFSTGKLKQMFNIMHESVDHLIVNLEKKAEQKNEFNIYEFYQGLTLDVIGRCAFGLQTNAQTDPCDPFFVNIQKLFKYMTNTFILPLVMLFPFIQYFIFAIKNIVMVFGMNPVVWLRNQLRSVIRIRKDMGDNSNVVDIVQQMLFTSSNKFQKMSEREIVAQSMTFLLAGYETTSAVLSFLCYTLVKNPHVQRRLCKEIDDKIGDCEVTYQTIQDLPYFDRVFDEVCRLYPTASLIVTRQAAESRCYNGIHIPAEMNIQANVWGLHHDDEFWENPETFLPERFLPENKDRITPYTFLPFGAGPRSCIGSRFAMLETKIAIARVLKTFQFQPGQHLQDELSLECRGAIVPKDSVSVFVSKRKYDEQIQNYRYS